VADAVAVFHHHRKGDQAHGDDRSGDRAGDGAQDRTDQNDRIREAAAQTAEKLPKAFEQILGQPAALENRSHEGEERNCEQKIVGENGEKLKCEVAKKIGRDQPQLNTDQSEEQTDRGQGKRGRIANHHEQHQPSEHEGRHILPHQIRHCTGLSYDRSWRWRAMRAAAHLMISEIPCRATSANPSGSVSLTGHRSKPPALAEVSPS
jgi:hypothetical protein